MYANGPVRVGVIGAGVMGERHARVFAQHPDVRLVGVFDVDAENAIEVARAHGSNAFNTVADLLRAVDAVSIASPTSTHIDYALQAMDLGLHLLIEKPMAATLEESHLILEQASHHTESLVMVGHIERFNPTVIELRRLLAGQRIVSMTMRRMSPFHNRALDTDVIHDLMIHDIDLLLDLMGDQIDGIDAIGSPVRTPHLDQAMAQITMTNGTHVDLIASRVANRKVRALDIRTDDARIIADLLDKSIEIKPGSADSTTVSNGHITNISVASTEPLRLELGHFIDCIMAGGQPKPDVTDGHRAMVYANCIQSLIGRSLATSGPAPSIARIDD